MSILSDVSNPSTAPYRQLRGKGIAPLQAAEQIKNLSAKDNPVTNTGLFHQAFVAEHGREPTTAEVVAYQRSTNPSSVTAGPARSDQSVQYNSGELDKLENPISSAVQRLGRLQDTLDQHSPQADALVAPELLTIMAGGAGSGLRMNEAEISRIVGGRSKWEGLKAAAQQWSLNPETARSITADQDQQIRSLVSAVNTKLMAKSQALQSARDMLLNSDDPLVHRKAVNDARQALLGIDSGSPAKNTKSQFQQVRPGVMVEK